MDSRIEEILKEKVGDPYEEVPLMSRIEILLDRLGSGSGDSSEYAHSLELAIDSQTYVMTATLKNTDGEVLGTPQTIDFPLETMVVNGAYDSATKKVILTLKNGNTVDFSVADLVEGLQSEITSSNKLNSDLVDDTNQNNKFVTSAEKTKIANALTEEVYNAGKQVKTNNKTGEIFNDYRSNKATGICSHAEGTGTTASGNFSHTEGIRTTATGDYSHAEGGDTIAASIYQHAQGKFNIKDSNGKYAFIIGNGTSSDARSNSFAVDWNGLIYVNNSATGVNVSQLQPIIDSTNKLDSDLVDDTDPNVNKFVTSAEKTQIATNTHDIAIIKSMLTTTFGFKINKNDMNPNTRVEYLYDAVGMNPAYMDFTNDVFSYGDWGNAWFVKDNRPVALKFDGTVDYELDHSDFTKKLDGTASDITDATYSGNFMSEIPLCYIKRWEDENYNYIAISNMPVDDSYKAYAHTNANGIIKPQIYLPMFKGSVVSNKLRSIAGLFPAGNTSGAEEVSYAEACGSGWQLWDWSKHELIADLLTLISKSTDSKSKFGNGDINTSRNTQPDYGKQPTGGYCSTVGDLSTFAVDSNGQFYGKNDDTHHVTTLYIEDFWGNRADRCLGLNLVNNTFNVKTIPPYTLDADNTYTNLVAPDLILGWLKNISTTSFGTIPRQTGASETTGYCNYFYSGNSSSVCLAFFGGSCDNGSSCGYRFVNLANGSAFRYRNISGSPCFNPL